MKKLYRKKVMILSNTRGGILSFTMSLAQKLVHQGCCVNLFFLDQPENGKLSIDSERMGFNYLTTHSTPNFRTLFSAFFTVNPDIVQISFASFGLLALLKKIVNKTPFVLTVHGLPQPSLESSWRNKTKYSVESLLLPVVARHASATIAVSNYVKKALSIRYGLDSQVIYHGVNSDRLKPRNKKQAKKRLGYDENDSIVLFVGNLNLYKDPLTLIRAFARAVKIKESQLIIVGTGELFKQVAQEIEKLDLTDHVRLLEHLTEEELTQCYIAADVFVLPTVNEAFGIVLLEAMAFGVPIIASNSGACPEVIGEAGVLFNQGDPITLSSAMVKLLSDKELSKKLSELGLARVKKLFSLDDKMNQYWELFKRLTAR